MGEWLGIAAIGSFITASWSYIRSWWAQVWSMLFVTATFRPYLSWAVEHHIWQTYKPVKFGPRVFAGVQQYINTTERQAIVGYECAPDGGRLFYGLRCLLWMSRSDSPQTDGGRDGYIIKLTYLRGAVAASAARTTGGGC